MRTVHRTALLGGAAGLALLASAGGAFAQSTPTPAPTAEPDPEASADLGEVVVVGSQIRGASTTAALPVVVFDQEQIDAIGAVSGDDLMRSIPQMGDVLFEAANNPQTSNSARGDVNSVNLRSLGVGNTLVLLNGRRMVQHPTSQGTSDTGTVPVLSYNSNAIPVSGLERLEVLLDGAAAIYGADAVAGVVNTVLQNDFDGLRMEAEYSGAEGTGLREFEANVFAGRDFDRGNISLFANYSDRTALMAEDQDFTFSDDLRSFFANEPGFETSTVPDGRSSNTPWARLRTPGSSTAQRPRSNGVIIATSAGAFHYQPQSIGCVGVNFGNGICLVQGNGSYNGDIRNLRYDTRHGTTVRSALERTNVFLTGHYDLTPTITAFGEIGFYGAESRAIQPPVVNLNDIWIPASNYWNPFGPVTFANGSANPNRLPNLTNVPAAGLPIFLENYRFVDAGFQEVVVKNFQSRFLGGLRGEWRGFEWESALLYSEAEAEDRSPNINMTALQRQLALSTPDAYNPFGGGCVDTTSFGDCSPSSQAAIDAITFEMRRFSRTTLALADFKMSRGDLFELPGGPVGVAFGAEFRRETQFDDRDENLDGTFTFVDMVSGATSLSNVSAVSPNPDTRGSRTVAGAFLEFAVPVVSPEMGIPLVYSLDMQLAGRFEEYSDFGSVAKPKIAVAWDLFDGLRIRGSYSEGFRAPNLEQVNASQYARLASGTDYYRCEPDLRDGSIASMSQCSQGASASLLIAGNPDLEPEESTNQSVGLVFQPRFLPEAWGDFTFTVDRWKIEQEQIVGLLGAQAALTLDYLNRIEGGSNPNVVRRAPDADDILLFDGSGLAPVGDVVSINDRFINLLPQTVEGVDFGFSWAKRRTAWGTFIFRANASQLLTYSREPGDIIDSLYAARDAGTIDALTPLPDSSQLIAQNGRPEWKVSTSFIWRSGPWRAGLSTQYVSDVEQTGLLSSTGEPWVVQNQLVANLYGQYEFEDAGFASGATVRIGVRDLADEGPSLAENGYLGSIQRPYGRSWYVNIAKTF
ncbi:MAG: TonB-dependent receptor [Alphaproteobacteria bacterium]|jgi:iron complex outermembrane recepter protein|nr:TonB-dependent receptor [Alphaproteobacteria bacterium]MBU2042533.1 TonB-dependent receptor [Alphaproteobacteria bacterium]MBU2125641.1 TonB-dependent receptor [Alphaproteobacteria bacterium]MBU2209905.1 TonB-dependent receptor [Alphaproteobacteria bacterium]MBU2292382.1 TonB-dependent receptor [Alphaproteobacteria bacterium]